MSRFQLPEGPGVAVSLCCVRITADLFSFSGFWRPCFPCGPCIHLTSHPSMDRGNFHTFQHKLQTSVHLPSNAETLGKGCIVVIFERFLLLFL